MKKSSLLLSLLVGLTAVWALSPFSAAAHQHHQSGPERQSSELEHGIPELQAPLPPRKVSPYQFEQQQQNLKKTPSVSAKVQVQKTALQSSSCASPAQLLPLQDQALIQAIESANLTSCLYGLYNANFLNSDYFTDSKLLTIVQAIHNRMAQFDGSDATGAAELEKLVTYLRAAHWVESASGREFQSNYLQQLQQVFDQYFAGEHFVRFDGASSRNFMLRYEMLVLVNSSGTNNLRYLRRFSQAIKGYASTVNRQNNWGVGYEENGMTQLLTHYFNANNSNATALQQLVTTQPDIITNLRDFVLSDGLWLVGHTREYQWADAVTELGRFLKLGGAVADSVRPAMQSILSSYSFGGTGSKGWVNAQRMVSIYDQANCASYGEACAFDLEATVLSGQHICSDSLEVRFQPPVSTGHLQQICQQLHGQEQQFHLEFGTNANSPVSNDQNSALEIVIFNSSAEYQNYAGSFFGIDTNNGGMYLEGTPSDPANQARFIAYQATWLQPEFVVWNLNHEYIHYLDGRFNQWGSFSDQPANLVWWGEGLAEYLSIGDDNPKVVDIIANKTYSLSQLFQTTYANSNTERTYYWGYLATRFMFERHRDLIDNQLLPSMRAAKYYISDLPCSFDWGWRSKSEAITNQWSWLYDDSANSEGNWVWTCGQMQDPNVPELPPYTPYSAILAAWGNNFDQEFDQWLDCLLTSEDCSQTEPAIPLLLNGQSVAISGLKDSEQHLKIELPANAYDLSIVSSGGTGDLDLYVRSQQQASLSEWDYRPYAIGNREKVDVLQPTGDYFVMVHGYRDFSAASLTASWKEGSLSQLQQWPGLSSTSAVYQWLWVPAHAKALYFTLSGGTGDAQLYVKRVGWPAPNNYDAASSISRGTSQKITMSSVVPGSYYHIMVNTLQGFNNVELKVLMVE
jgi:microbial collagenase